MVVLHCWALREENRRSCDCTEIQNHDQTVRRVRGYQLRHRGEQQLSISRYPQIHHVLERKASVRIARGISFFFSVCQTRKATIHLQGRNTTWEPVPETTTSAFEECEAEVSACSADDECNGCLSDIKWDNGTCSGDAETCDEALVRPHPGAVRR